MTCPICQEGPATRTTHHTDFEGSDVYYCGDCTHWFVQPEPSLERLAEYYEGDYGERRSAYFGRQYYTLMRRRARAQADFILDRIRDMGTPLPESAVDLGCGVGALVAELSARGIAAEGYDGDPEALEVASSVFGANVFPQTTLLPDVGERRFQLLCMSHLVEHLADLRATLARIIELLAPGGFVFIEVPACFPEMFEAKLDMESHLHFFTGASMRRLLEATGLEVCAGVSCGPPKFRGYGLHEDPRYQDRDPADRWLGTRQRLRDALLRRIPGLTSVPGYDGYYARYYADEGKGMWLRFLGRKPCIAGTPASDPG